MPTACRSGEARLATWEEIDLRSATWEIPGSRMKAKHAHRVPLSAPAVELLDDARRLSDGSGLLSPSPSSGGRPAEQLSNNTLIKPCDDLRLGCTPHGMRSSFRTWCSETEQPRELAEQCPCRPEARRGGLHALRLVRAAAGTDGNLERLPLATESTVTCLTIHDMECTVERVKYTEQCCLSHSSYWDDWLCENDSVSTGRQSRS